MTEPRDPPRQLPLMVSLPDDARLSALFRAPNDWFLDWLETVWQDSLQGGDASEQSLFIHAPPGGGLTHLLQALCRQGEEADLAVFYLSLRDLADYGPDVLEDMSAMTLLCLDDMDAVLGKPTWDEALFHLFNQQRDQGHQLIMGSHRPLTELEGKVLPDLHSRLSWGMVANWRLPEDEQWEAAIQSLAHRRGLQMGPDAARYLALRGPRDWSRMAALMTELDTRALAEKRRLTQPFIRAVTGWQG